MKKTVFAVLICLLLALCLAACTPNDPADTTASQESGTLLVGFGREDFSPYDISVPLHGYPSNLASGEVWDPLYATCIAFTDSEDNTLLVFHMDMLYAQAGGAARRRLREKYGIPTENVIVCATHTHSGPSLSSQDPALDSYYDFIEDQMFKAAESALADRKPAKMFTASTELERLNFVRHYYMSDGSVVGDNFGDATGKTYVKHVRDADNQMQLVRFKREGGKDVVLVNFQVHPIRTSSSKTTHVTADIIGAMRMALEPQMDCYMAYFTGGAGNLDPTSRISGETLSKNYLDHGAIMAQEAVMACDNMQLQKTGKVQVLQKQVDVPINKMAVTFKTSVFSIGDVAFAIAPYEMFDDNAKFVKDNSPFAMTFVSSCSGGSNGYVAAYWAYEYEGQVAYEVANRGYNKGSGEMLASSYVDMLEQLHSTRDTVDAGTAQLSNAPYYYNLDAGAKLTADANGVYTVRFLIDGQVKTYKVTDKAVLDTLLGMDFVTLTLDGDTVTGVKNIIDLEVQRIAWNYHVQSVGATAAKLNSRPTMDAKELTLKFAKDMPVYDVVPGSSTLGSKTQMQKNDQVTVIADLEGNPLAAYVVGRTAVLQQEKKYCEHCKKDVQWFGWLSTTSLPFGDGHFILNNDITLTQSATIGSVNLCIDLNGKTVTQSKFGTRMYSLQGSGTLSIMDSVGGGSFVPASADMASTDKYGMFLYLGSVDAVLNLYSGTIDASKVHAYYGAAVSMRAGTFNMYGGTILGGTSFGPGANAISANGNFNMYGGRITGGKSESTSYTVPVGGAAIRVIGTTTIYGGIIESGEHVVEGGLIRVAPEVEGAVAKLILKGGTITNGKSPVGGGIVCPFGSTVVISGNVKITGNENGNLYLKQGVTFSIGEEGLGEEAQIGITMEQPGKFLSDAPAGVDIAKFFTSDESGKKIIKNSDGSWSLQ